MTTSVQQKSKRRPGIRAARREENTSRILDASIHCLNKYSYGGTTLAVIAQAAGVSRGQVQNIFGLKRSDLLVRIAKEIFDRYVLEYQAAVDAASSPVEMVENTWDAMQRLYSRPETLALIDLWLGTRNDRTFHKGLRDMLVRADSVLGEKWEAMFARSNVDVAKVAVIRILQRSVMRGLAIERLSGSGAVSDSVFEEARKATVRLIKSK